jgi:nicotinamidase-related amidase
MSSHPHPTLSETPVANVSSSYTTRTERGERARARVRPREWALTWTVGCALGAAVLLHPARSASAQPAVAHAAQPARADPPARLPARASAQQTTSPYLVKLTPENSALIMVDYLTGFWPGLRSIDSVAYENNVTALAKIGAIFALPTIVLGDEGGFRGTFYPQITENLPRAQRIARQSPSAWKEPTFRTALERAGRRKLIIAGISVDNCVLQTSLDLLRAGYEVYVVVDASGTDTRLVEDAALMRLAQAGAVMTSWVSLASELMDDWRNPTGQAVGLLYQQHSAWGAPPPRGVPADVQRPVHHRTPDHRTPDHRTPDHRTPDHRTPDHRTPERPQQP